jgi:hypothetical protein
LRNHGRAAIVFVFSLTFVWGGRPARIVGQLPRTVRRQRRAQSSRRARDLRVILSATALEVGLTVENEAARLTSARITCAPSGMTIGQDSETCHRIH